MSNKCVCCNVDIPEGNMVCQACVYKEYGIVVPKVFGITMIDDSKILPIDNDGVLKERILKKLNESVPILDIARELDITVMKLTDIIFNAIWEEK